MNEQPGADPTAPAQPAPNGPWIPAWSAPPGPGGQYGEQVQPSGQTHLDPSQTGWNFPQPQWPDGGYSQQAAPAIDTSRPGSLAFASGVSALLGSIFGCIAAVMIFGASVVLAAQNVLRGALGSGAFGTADSLASDGSSRLVLLGLLFFAVATVLCWGAFAAYGGQTSAIAITGLALAALLNVVFAVIVHPVLLILAVLPAIGLIALLQPRSRYYMLLDHT